LVLSPLKKGIEDRSSDDLGMLIIFWESLAN